MILLRPICWLLGHKRGKILRTIKPDDLNQPVVSVYSCPRCGRETRYKVKQLP